MTDWLMKFGPQIIGLALFMGGIAFFVGRFLLVRVFKSIDLLFLKFDAHSVRIRRLELLAASKADNTALVAKIMGDGS